MLLLYLGVEEEIATGMLLLEGVRDLKVLNVLIILFSIVNVFPSTPLQTSLIQIFVSEKGRFKP